MRRKPLTDVPITCCLLLTCASLIRTFPANQSSSSSLVVVSSTSTLDEQETDVSINGELLAKLCKTPEQPFVDELSCSGLGISSLNNARLTPSDDIPYRKLDLAGNRLTALTNTPFEGHGVTYLRQLDLSSNFLQSIHSKAFASLTRLAWLNLANNQLRTLPSDLFVNLPTLFEVNLADNQLSLSSINRLPSMPNVQRLDLSGNAYILTESDGYAALGAEQLPNLIKLKLANCALRNLSESVFAESNDSTKQLSHIQRLDLSGNRFEKVPNRALSRLPRLHVLIFNDIPNIYNLNRDQLTGLEHLRSLHLNRASRLRSIGPLTFAGQPLLRELICTQNPKLIRIEANAFNLEMSGPSASVDSDKKTTDQWTSLHPAAISTKYWPLTATLTSKDRLLKSAATSPLRILHLQQNALTNVNARLINFGRLRSLDLSGNPLRCDCSLNFMFELSQSGVIVRNANQTKCGRPRRWNQYTVFEAAAISNGASKSEADTSGFHQITGQRLQFNCQKLFDEDNDVFWGMFLLLVVCFGLVVLAFCAMSLHVRNRMLNCFHDCCALVGFRRSLLNCYDCCGLLKQKGSYRTFERRETQRNDQTDASERIRADLEWDHSEMDF